MGFCNKIYDPKVQKFIVFVIIVNAITLGLETSQALTQRIGGLLHVIDTLCLAIFTVEIAMKLVVRRLRFFADPWNIFDFLVVGISYVPAVGSLSVLRSLRVLRVLRLLSSIPRLRVIVQSLINSLPSIGWILLLMSVLFYVFAVIGTKLFGAAYPEWFGSLSETFFTLFQVMTLESWCMGIARPVMDHFPYAYLFFVPFVLITSFIILNVFIAVILNGMSEAKDHPEGDGEEKDKDASPVYTDREELLEEIARLRRHMDKLEILAKNCLDKK